MDIAKKRSKRSSTPTSTTLAESATTTGLERNPAPQYGVLDATIS